MSTTVFVLDKKHRPLMPCRPARARRLLRAGRARVVKRFPFVIRLVDRTVEQSEVQPALIKLDPGSRETGAAVVRDDGKKRHHALAFFVIEHRGGAIRDALKARSAFWSSPRFNPRSSSSIPAQGRRAPPSCGMTGRSGIMRSRSSSSSIGAAPSATRSRREAHFVAAAGRRISAVGRHAF